MGSETTTTEAKIPDATPEEQALWNLISTYDKQSASQASDLSQKGYDSIMALDGNTPDFSSLGNENQSRLDDIYQKYQELYEGKLNPSYQANLEKSLQSGYENTLGSSLNTLSNRGVLNSKVTNTAINSQQKNLATALAAGFNNNINTEASLLKAQQDLAAQKLTDASKSLTGQLALPTTYYTLGSTLKDSVDKDWTTMYNDRYSIATPAQTTTTGSVLGGLLTGVGTGLGIAATGGSSAACFNAGTIISMADGSDKYIEDVVPGDKILSYDFAKKDTVDAVVKAVSKPVLSNDQYIEIDCGDCWIKTTAKQPFFAEHGFVFADALVIGDKLFDGEKDVIVKDIIFIDDKELVYDICASGSNTYFADGVLVLGGVY